MKKPKILYMCKHCGGEMDNAVFAFLAVKICYHSQIDEAWIDAKNPIILRLFKLLRYLSPRIKFWIYNTNYLDGLTYMIRGYKED